MKTLNVPCINPDNLSEECLRSELLAHGADAAVDCVNWKEYPYKPTVKLKVAHSSSHLFVMFDVTEDHVLGTFLNWNENVWEDSCAELFIGDPDGVHYFNFETNCIGTGLAARRLSAPEAVMFTNEQMAQLIHYSSLPHKPIDSTEVKHWQLIVGVPFKSVGYNTAPSELRANVYKCGDHTRVPHFLSWSEIDMESPCFHCPQFFGTFVLE